MNDQRRKRQGTAIAILLGIALFFILPLILAPVLQQPAWIFLSVFMSCYFMIAFGLGFLWPAVSWRAGLWLFLVWPGMLLFGIFLTGEQPWHWKRELLSLAEYASLPIAACIGGWLGAVFAKRRKIKMDRSGTPSPIT